MKLRLEAQLLLREPGFLAVAPEQAPQGGEVLWVATHEAYFQSPGGAVYTVFVEFG